MGQPLDQDAQRLKLWAQTEQILVRNRKARLRRSIQLINRTADDVNSERGLLPPSVN